MNPQTTFRALLVNAVSLALLVTPAPTRAGTMTGGATEWTQIMNNVALLQQVIHAIQQVIALKRQVEYWKQTLQTFKSPQDALMILNGVQSVLSTARGIVFAGESLAARWKQTHPGFKDPQTLGFSKSGPGTDVEAYRRIDASIQKSVENSLKLLDAQAHGKDGFEKDQQILRNLQAKMSTVNGQLQAAQVANELLLEIIRQLHLVRQVLIVQAHVQGEYVSGEAQRRQYDDAIRERRNQLTGRFEYTGRFRGPESLTLDGPTTGNLAQDAPTSVSAPSGETYMTPDGRTVQLAPGASRTENDAYQTPQGRDIQLAPGTSRTENDAYQTPQGRDIQLAPGASRTENDAYQTPQGRDIQLAPGAPLPPSQDASDSELYDDP